MVVDRRLVGALVAVTLGAQTVRAEPDTPQLSEPAIERENLQRLQSEQQRLEREELVRETAERAEAQRAQVARLSREAYDADQAARTHRRHQGYGLAVVSVLFGGSAIVFGQLGKRQDDRIKHDTFAFPSELEDEATRGRYYNYAAYGSLIGAGIFAVVAVPLIVFNLPRHEYQVRPISLGTGGTPNGFALEGRF